MTSDERIEALLKRAGQPLLVVKNPDKADPFYREMERLVMPRADDNDSPDQYCDVLLAAIERLAKEKQELVDLVDRLEIALENKCAQYESIGADFVNRDHAVSLVEVYRKTYEKDGQTRIAAILDGVARDIAMLDYIRLGKEKDLP